MLRRSRFSFLALPLLLTACADPNKKTEATPDYQYTPSTTSSGKSSTGTNPGYSNSNTTYSPTPASPTGYSSDPTTTYTPPANSATNGAGSSTMKVSDEPMTAKKSSTAKTGGSSKSSGGGQTYTVKKGDTLSEIAKREYGDANKWQKIYNANKSRIGPDPKKLQIGTKLIIP